MFNVYLVFIVSKFLHLPSRISPLGMIRFDLLLQIILAYGVFAFGIRKDDRPSSAITKKLLIIIGYILITLPLVKWPGSVLNVSLLAYLKVIVFFFFTLTFVTTEKRLKLFLLVFIGCQIFRAIEPTFLHFTEGYWGSAAFSTVHGFHKLDRLAGAPHDVINPNQLAWVVVSTIPFLYFLCWKSENKLLKIISAGLVPVLLIPLFLTGSRTGVIILIVVILAILLMEGLKAKTVFLAGIVIIPAVIIISSLLSPDLAQRYLSIVDGDAVGAGSFNSRINGMVTVIRHMNIRVIFGHGLGTSGETNWNIIGRSDHRTHNMYLEAIQEIGIIGLILLLRFIYTIYQSLNAAQSRIVSSGKEDSWYLKLVLALKAWILMDIVYSIACFALTHWEWYFFGGLSAVCVNLVAEATADRKATVEEKEPETAGQNALAPKINAS